MNTQFSTSMTKYPGEGPDSHFSLKNGPEWHADKNWPSMAHQNAISVGVYMFFLYKRARRNFVLRFFKFQYIQRDLQ